METTRALEQKLVERKIYQKPELVEYGELKDLTLGSGGKTADKGGGSYGLL